MSHSLPRSRVRFSVSTLRAAEDRKKTTRRFQHVFVDGVTPAGSQRGVDGAQGRVTRVVLARPTVGADREAAHRRRGQADRVRHLLVGQPEELRGRDDPAERDDHGGVETLPVGAERLADPACSLVARHDRAEQVLARRAGALADRETGRGESRAGVSDVTQVAVVRSGSVAEHGVDSRDRVDRQLGTVEPHGGFRLAATLLRQFANNARRVDDVSQARRSPACWR